MGGSDWQLWVTLAVVTVAVAALVRRGVKFFSGRGQSACGDCPGRASAGDSTDRQVVTGEEIELLYKQEQP